MKACNECGWEVARDARICPSCGHEFFRLGCIGTTFVIIGVLFLCGAIASFFDRGTKKAENSEGVHTDSIGRSVPENVTNDAELLLYRCGKPDKDDSTENDNPRPPIPSRIIEYRKPKLRFAYAPGVDTRLGDPPPYKWKMLGIVDLRTNKAVSAAQLESVLSKRLPCSIGR